MDIDQEIIRLKQLISEKRRYTGQLDDIKEEFALLKNKENELRESLIKEEADVKRLEATSFTNFWYSLIGSKVEKLDKEKREFSKAEYEYKLNQNKLENLNKEINDIENKLTSFQEGEAQLEKLLVLKEEAILGEDSDSSIKLKDINNQYYHCKKTEKELNEAILAGENLMDRLYVILNNLNKARNWGTWDMLGGGFIANVAKHSNIDEAKAGIADLKYHSDRFVRELKDVNITSKLDIDISSGLRFADWFFDGLFVDLVVQSKINDSIDRVENQIAYIQSILNNLNKELKENNQIAQSKIEAKNQLLQKPMK